MKKICILLAVASFFIFSCTKTENEKEAVVISYPHYAVPIENNLKDVSNVVASYTLATALGHPAEGCTGCIMFDGKPTHRDCAGFGDACAASVSASLYSASDKSNDYNVVTTDKYGLTGDDVFFMPDRSFLVIDKEDKQLWLNIPQQLAVRDAKTFQFTFYGVYYSNSQVFNND